MKVSPWIILSLASVLVAPQTVSAATPPPWQLPKNRDVYLMEDDLVYARFLELSRDGTYRQINRDSRGNAEVDRGHWEQDATGALRLCSTCHALRPRALLAGPLSVIIAEPAERNLLPALLASMRRFLATYPDVIFAATTAAELNATGGPAVQIDSDVPTFERKDATALVARIVETLQSERDGTDVLEPLTGNSTTLFRSPASAFRDIDVANLQRTYGLRAQELPPFFFLPIDAATYAREVGSWRPLGLPIGLP